MRNPGTFSHPLRYLLVRVIIIVKIASKITSSILSIIPTKTLGRRVPLVTWFLRAKIFELVVGGVTVANTRGSPRSSLFLGLTRIAATFWSENDFTRILTRSCTLSRFATLIGQLVTVKAVFLTLVGKFAKTEIFLTVFGIEMSQTGVRG